MTEEQTAEDRFAEAFERSVDKAYPEKRGLSGVDVQAVGRAIYRRMPRSFNAARARVVLQQRWGITV